MKNNQQAIAIFDSGFTGLSILKDLMSQYPNEDFIYLADTARFHYGNKSPQIIKKYLSRNIQFLFNLNVKAIVVPCSTSSSFLRFPESQIPIYSAVRSNSYIAAIATKNNKVGLIATNTTVNSKSYATAIQYINEEISVYQVASPLLVHLVEEGWQNDPLTNLVVHRYVAPLLQTGIDTLILGASQFLQLKDTIKKVCENKIQLIDTAFSLSQWLKQDFDEKKLLPNKDNHSGQLKIYSTDLANNIELRVQNIMNPIAIESFFEAEL